MNDDKYQKVIDLISSKKDSLSYIEEDSKLLLKLWSSYWKKRKGKVGSSQEVLAAAVLWQYSSNNFLWGKNKNWTQKSLAELFQVKSKTISDNSRQIRRLLKIKYFDDRFCRKEVADSNPLKQMVMTQTGFILDRKHAKEEGIPFALLKKDKEDYYYDGMEQLDAGSTKKAQYYFKKALEIDDEFVDAYNGMGTMFWYNKNIPKAKEWYQKAYELTKKHFNYTWPKEINWGIMENRQYLRSIQYYGLVLWREGNNKKALELFKLLLKLNRNDNQGARYLTAALYAGKSWEQMEDNQHEEDMLEEQNKKHNFWEVPVEYENEEDDFWEEGSFAETVDPNDKGKMRTFHMKHDEEMNYNCKKCDKKISAHNKDWHAGMCDGCFDEFCSQGR